MNDLQAIWLWNGLYHKIPLCCILFFLTKFPKEYTKYKTDFIQCPDCIVKEMRKNRH